MSLVETDWLDKNLNSVKIIDCSWHMPQTNRVGFEEYQKQHISNAIFFDLDKNSKKNTNLPHMLVEKSDWEKIVSEMGINNEDKIVIYDNSDVISSCRCWFNFIYFGHNPRLVHVLNGGFKKWIDENKEVTNELPNIEVSDYNCLERKELVKDKNGRKELAASVGKAIAKRLIEKGIKDVAFDKGGYKYHGLIKILADSAREEGLNF